MWGLNLVTLRAGQNGRRDLGQARWSAVLEVVEAHTALILKPREWVRSSVRRFLTKTTGESLGIVHLAAKGAGAEARMLLHMEYAGSSAARLGTTVRGGVPERRELANASAGTVLARTS